MLYLCFNFAGIQFEFIFDFDENKFEKIEEKKREKCEKLKIRWHINPIHTLTSIEMRRMGVNKRAAACDSILD